MALGAQTLLESLAFREPTRKDYLKRVVEFSSFVVRRNLPVVPETALDHALCVYGDALFLDGYSSGEGTKLLVAVEAMHPSYLRKGRLTVPRFRRALKAWARLAPTRVSHYKYRPQN